MGKQTKTDKLEFCVINKNYEDDLAGRVPFSSTQICVNGKNLILILRQYELTKFPSELSGNYEGIDPKSLYQEFTKQKGVLHSCEVEPFQCGRHLNNDWVIRFSMRVADDVVVWDNFRLLARSHGVVFEKKYHNFRTFTFSKKQSQEALEKLRKKNN
jgi:hypothetical protein